MPNPNRAFPEPLAKLNRLNFDYADGDGIDFEPYSEFLSAEETTSWFRAWTGNDEADGASFRVFGQDGAGGYSAFWVIHPDKGLLEQPIVFLSSEGDTGVVASNFDAYLWLLASGIGPFEAVVFGASDGSPNEQFAEFAQEHSSSKPMDARAILEHARTKYPDFTAQIEALCQ